jgi:hypothetical protein
MASLVYDLSLTEFHTHPVPQAEYAYYGDGGLPHLMVLMPEGELVSEFGLVPESLHVVVKVTADVPADAWLDAGDPRISGKRES